ncbi:MAG: hypothetical protein AB7C95_04710 [Synergistaceae bacterium]
MAETVKFKVKMKDSEIIEIAEARFKIADDYYTTEMQPKIEKWVNQYNASEEYYKELFSHLSESSNYRSTDVQDTVEFIMPDMMKIFQGSNESYSIKGRTEEDAPGAKANKNLINWQLNTLNNGFIIDYMWIKDALKKGIGVQKGMWVQEFEYDKYENYVNYEQLLAMTQAEHIEVKSYEQLPPPYNYQFYVKFKLRRVIKNEPKIENVPIEDFRFIIAPNSMELTTAFHIMDKTIDHLRRKEQAGEYKNVEDAVKNNQRDTDRDEDKRRDRNETSSGFVDDESDDEPSRIVTIKEMYCRMDVNKDGLLEDVIVTYCADTLLSIRENTYGTIPFFILPGAAIESGKVNGRALAEGIGQIQDLKTALRKQYIIAIAETNHQRKFIPDDGLYWQDIEDNSEFVRYDVNRFPRIQDAIGYEPQKPIHTATFKLFEMLEADKEQKSGINQFKMGIDNKVSNKAYNTATGANLLAQASNARVDIMARIMANTGFKQRAEWMLESNQKFITQEQVVRLENEYLTIRPDDLQGKYDYEVSSGIGTGTSQQTLEHMNTILGLSTNVLLPNGLTEPAKIRNIAKTMIEAMGYKDVDNYLMSEQEIQQRDVMNQAAVQLLQIFQSMPPQILQALPPQMQQQIQAISQRVQAGAQPQGNNQPPQADNDTQNRAMAMIRGAA